MNCDDIKNTIIAGIYGQLNAGDQKAIEDHVSRCPSCQATYREAKMYLGAFESNDEVPLPDWEKSWDVIAARALEPKRRFPFFLHYRRIALAAASVVLVFAIGLLAGRQLFGPGDRPGQLHNWAGYTYTSHQNYAENLELLLINFANRGDKPAAQEFSQAEQAIVGDILTQTRLLKQIAFTREDAFLLNLLDDIELILIGISNLDPGDRDSADQLNQFIQKKSLKLRLDQLAKQTSA
jgi:hypothetical protein